MQSIFQGQDPVDGPIDLYEAMARALKYNLDYRVKLMEKAIARQQLRSSYYDMLPELTAKAGYTHRNNFAGGLSKNLFTGAVGTDPTASQERDRRTADLSLTWNILDFGLSFYQAKQQGNNVLIAHEQKRKAIQNIMQEVRFAYWRAVSADRLIGDIETLKKEVEVALSRARSVEKERVDSPLKALNYQRNMLEILKNLNNLRRNLSFAKAELASLMNLRPGEKFVLADTKKEVYAYNDLKVTPTILEKLALINRPELREEDYKYRNNGYEITKAWLELLPGISINTGFHYDSNFFTLNNHWRTALVEASLDVFQLIRGPVTNELLKRQGKLIEAQRLSMSMAVITQVHIAYQRFKMSKEDFVLAKQMKNVSQRIFQQVKNREKTEADDEQQVILSSANALIGRMQKEVAYAELQNALGTIYFSVGLDPVPHHVKSHKIDDLATALRTHLGKWKKQEFFENLSQRLTATKEIPTKK